MEYPGKYQTPIIYCDLELPSTYEQWHKRFGATLKRQAIEDRKFWNRVKRHVNSWRGALADFIAPSDWRN